MTVRLTRRGFLQGAGGVIMGLPLLGHLPGRAASRTLASPPTRLLIFVTPNGCVQGQRLLSTHETDFQLGAGLAPLSDHRQHLVFVDGMRVATSELGPGDPHQRGMGQMLTGMPLEEGLLFEPFDGGLYAGWATGQSVDQRVADLWLGETWLKSLEVGVQTLLRPALDVWGVCSYAGPGQPIPPDNDPHRVFQRLFGAGALGGSSIDRLRTRRQSVLDVVLADFQSLEGRLGAADSEKLEAHADHLRDLEKRLEAIPRPADGCAPGDAPGQEDAQDPDRFEKVGEAQMDLLVQALACDLTRVATLQWSAANGDHIFSDLGLDMGHHAITHEVWDELVTQQLVDVDAWYARQFAGLLERLASVPEGDGTLLDNTLVFWTNELDEGYAHTFENMPYVLAGGAGIGLQGGRCLRFPGQSHTDLLLSLLHLLGIPDESFGHPDYGTGPLVGLV